MEMPFELREALEQQLQDKKLDQMMLDSQAISLRYRTQGGKGERLLTSDDEALSYAVSRMPATFGAVFEALDKTITGTFEKEICRPLTLLDVGAGTGAASWAADTILELKNVKCLERELAMRILGKALMENGSQVLQETEWIEYDLDAEDIPYKVDIVIASYVLNEMTEDGRRRAIDKLWDSAQMIMLLVEPGTPVGFSHLNEARRILLERGAHIAAPCPHEADCPKGTGDWCHFTCRVARSRLHRRLKGGEAPYEDEKFSYVAFTRIARSSDDSLRILRHPQVRSGHVMLEVCTADGTKRLTLTKKDGERYKKARKASAGDEIN